MEALVVACSLTIIYLTATFDLGSNFGQRINGIETINHNFPLFYFWYSASFFFVFAIQLSVSFLEITIWKSNVQKEIWLTQIFSEQVCNFDHIFAYFYDFPLALLVSVLFISNEWMTANLLHSEL